MKIFLKKQFKKSLQKLPKKIQEKTKEVLTLLVKDQRHPSLRRHALKGEKKNYESLDVTGDIRIIIEPQTLEIIDIIDIGSHSQLY